MTRAQVETTGTPTDDVMRALANGIAGEVRFGLHDRLLYATDASLYQVEPMGVVIPASIEDAAAAVRVCAEHGLAILPRGGGTSLAGQCTNRAVVIDFSARCHGILELDIPGRRCRVEAGITIDDLNDRLRAGGMFFAPDPATSKHANIGGCIGNNAAGARSIRYGRTSENVTGIDVVLADGREVRLEEGAALRDATAAELTTKVVEVVKRHADLIRERFPKTVRRNAGYGLDMILAQIDRGGGDLAHVNLAPLLCGSEGTLAVTQSAELALHPLPKAKGLAVVAFASLDASMDALESILELGPSAVELLDDTVIDLARENIEYRRYVDLLPDPGGVVKAVHYVEFFSDDGVSEIDAKFGRLRAMFGDGAVECHTDAAAMLNAWKLRKAGEPLLHGVPGKRKPSTFVEDNAVPPERLPEFVRRFRGIVEAHGTSAAFYAHASVGVLHVRPLIDIKDPEDRDRMRSIAVEVADLAKELGGVMSGEHGDGRVRGPLLERFYGPELMGAFREIKAIFDPENRLNPGNIVDLDGANPRPIETITASLRVLPRDKPVEIAPVDTFYDYSDQDGFAHAVEMCNGAGVCRKKTGGAMCPSYMATLDERHSTRGRGNALRLAISGQVDLRPDADGAPAWGDAETEETLRLCLSCKACKAECPSNVDIARLKAEWQAQSYRAKGRVPLRARVFGEIHALNALAGVMPGLTNAINGFGPTRTLLDRVLGLHPKRSLPRFARPLHKGWDSGRSEEEDPRSGTARGGARPRIVIYGDTFTTYNEPEIGRAARRVFEAFGYTVDLFRGSDAGRAGMSTGLLPRVIERVDRELDRLRPLIEDEGVRGIIVCEPSVLSAMHDDWLQLKLRTPMELREKLRAKSWLPEQFVDRAWDAHPCHPAFRQPDGEVVLHAHCHQKALWGSGSTAELLHRVFPGRVRVLDTTCCGLAGSFGYTADRYELSMKIGELGVLPAARALGDGDVMIAPGTSCRHQIKDGTGRLVGHPVEFLAEMLTRS